MPDLLAATRRLVVGLSLVLTPLAVAPLSAQSEDSWRDPSQHRVRSVTVDSAVQLEVLDWGGSGRPVIFVGCYLTAHVYDNIAPKLTDQFHVYAVTRRGVGASDWPPTGYGPQRRADDILEVITALDLRKPILVGNSCGGDILNTLGARNPELIGGLMYLDAAEDPTLTKADARIRVPVMAIYRTVTMEQALEEYPPKTDQEREALNQAYRAGRAMLTKWQNDLRAGVPGAKIVELPGANLYMFLSHEADIIRELRAFAASLQR